MSYEGWEQHICANGHYFEDGLTMAFDENDTPKCPICPARSRWCNSVDQTNGPSEGKIPTEKLNQFIVTPAKFEACNLGHMHLIKNAVYRVPTREETDLLREYSSDED